MSCIVQYCTNRFPPGANDATCLCAQVYKERVLDVVVNCGQEAAKTGAKRFIEVSTAQVYDCDKVCVCVCVREGRGREGRKEGERGWCANVPCRVLAWRKANWIHGPMSPSTS